MSEAPVSDDFETISWAQVHRYGFEPPQDPNLTQDELNTRLSRYEEWEQSYAPVIERQVNDWSKLDPSVLSPKYSTDIVTTLHHKRLVRRGLPPHLRADFWYRASGAYRLQEESSSSYFTTLIDPSSHSKELDQDIERIDKDLERTFPTHPLFRSEHGRNQLRQCLIAFAMHYKDIGYAQSINFVMAIFNLFFSAEKSFWMLVSVLDTILPEKFYDRSLFGCRVEVYVVTQLVVKKLPKLSKVFQVDGVDVAPICLRWFLCLFLNTLPIETCMRVWDAMFLEGSKVLIRVALALFKLYEGELLLCQDTNQIYKVLQNIGKEQYDCDALLDIAFHRLGTLRRSQLEKLRREGREKIKTSDEEFEKRREQYQKEKQTR